MLKQEGAVVVEDSSSSNEPDDKDDDGDFESPVRHSPRNRTKSKKAVEAAGSDAIKEKLSDKFLAFDATKHKDWHASVSCLCFRRFLSLIVVASANCALAAAGAVSVPSSSPTVRSSIRSCARPVRSHRRSAKAVLSILLATRSSSDIVLQPRRLPHPVLPRLVFERIKVPLPVRPSLHRLSTSALWCREKRPISPLTILLASALGPHTRASHQARIFQFLVSDRP